MDSTNNQQKMKKGIFLKVLSRFAFAIIFILLLIFIPAGTTHFLNGWIFVAGLILPMLFALTWLIRNDPELLEKRVNLKEREKEQKKYVKISISLFILTYTIPGLDFRYGWSDVPFWVSVIALIIMIGGYVMFMVVMMQNRYASRVIEIQEEQKVIDTGLYSVVRHPMYLAASVLYLSSPIVLGSWYAVIPMAFLPVLLAYRAINEEKVLVKGLPGYEEYTKKVKYRIIPFVW